MSSNFSIENNTHHIPCIKNPNYLVLFVGKGNSLYHTHTQTNKLKTVYIFR